MLNLLVVGLKGILGILFIRGQDVGFRFIIFFSFVIIGSYVITLIFIKI
jgi:hypothetical protein